MRGIARIQEAVRNNAIFAHLADRARAMQPGLLLDRVPLALSLASAFPAALPVRELLP
jgi:hypothetical protein